MEKEKEKQQDKIEYNIYKTKEYDKFKFIKENREINLAHLKHLIESMKSNYLVSPILVNTKYEIIDGQHRFIAIKSLEKPLFYFIVPNYGIGETKIFNILTRTWRLSDFLNTYCILGSEDYIRLKDFRSKYPLPYYVYFRILAKGKSEKAISYHFKQGKLKFRTTEEIETLKIVRQILDFKDYYSKFKNRSFLIALLVMFETEGYNHEIMLKKLEVRAGSLTHTTNKDDYLKQLEDIYNFKNKERLRFFK